MVDLTNEQVFKEIMVEASQSDYTVIEFARMDDGSLNVVEITEHLRALEDAAEEEGWFENASTE